jgi:hypothetical protein
MCGDKVVWNKGISAQLAIVLLRIGDQIYKFVLY